MWTRAEEDITAVSDTLLDIQETVHGHTTTLGEIRQEQGRQAAKLDEISATLGALVRRLGEG